MALLYRMDKQASASAGFATCSVVAVPAEA
jgi:hypothetical protein